jgi:purine catabolism regulator
MKQFCVADLLKLPLFEDARLMCGKKGLENPITGINIIEAPDVAQWIQGGEVLLTNLYSLKALEPLPAFVKALAKKGLGALIVKVGVFVDAIPPELIRAAERYHLPIIEVSRDTLYRDIAFAVTARLLDERFALFKYIEEAHERFVQLSILGAGTQEIVEALAQFIENPVVIYDRDYIPIRASSPRFLSARFVDRPTDRKPASHFEGQIELENEERLKQIVFPVEIVGHVRLSLAAVCVNHELTGMQHIAIKNAINALVIELIKQQAVGEVEKRFHSDVLSDLLSGNATSLSSVLERASLLQWDLKKPHAVISFALSDKTFSLAQKGLDGERRAYDRLYEMLSAQFPHCPIQVRTDKLIMLWPLDDSSDKKWLAKVRAPLEKIGLKWEKQGKAALYMGIGNMANEPADLARSFQEAEDTLRIAKSMSFAHQVNAYQDLGVYRLLLQLAGRQSLAEFIPKAFGQLALVKQGGPTLMKTLKTYLQCDRNMSSTAKNLFVHVKTVAYRIERIKKLTGLSLTDPDEILHLQIGLKILSLLDAEKTPLRGAF